MESQPLFYVISEPDAPDGKTTYRRVREWDGSSYIVEYLSFKTGTPGHSGNTIGHARLGELIGTWLQQGATLTADDPYCPKVQPLEACFA